MAELFNRAKMTTSSTGTGTLTLGSVVAGFQTFAQAGVTNGDTVRYVIEDGVNFEIGVGVYTASGTTLSRGNVSESTSSDSEINLSGNATVSITATALDIGVTPVADQSAMLALTNPSLGNMAYRQDNYKLMMYNGTGWYVIATIQTTPTVSSVSQTTNGVTSTIAANGTFAMTPAQNTVVTVTGVDPDVGSTLTYSATVTSGTQSNVLASLTQSTNVFTLAPATSVGGTITIRFDVSDSAAVGNQSASFSLAFGISHSVQYLCIAGGGSGGTSNVDGYMAGGGGAGGFLYGTATLAASTTWTVTIGAGGAVVAGGTAASYNQGLNGSNSTISGAGVSATAIGGGGGAAGYFSAINGNAGGSGGGASRSAGVGGAATSGQGNVGGVGNDSNTNSYSGGGGGGASAVGASGVTTGKGGSGSNTYSSWHTATSTGVGGYVAAGGSGASYQGTNASINGGAGANNTSATANTGSGGGGAGSVAGTVSSGAGGSGLIIIRYTTPTDPNDVATGGTITTAGGYTYHTFLSSGTLAN